jgi:hypothetical protein
MSASPVRIGRQLRSRLVEDGVCEIVNFVLPLEMPP